MYYIIYAKCVAKNPVLQNEHLETSTIKKLILPIINIFKKCTYRWNEYYRDQRILYVRTHNMKTSVHFSMIIYH